MEQHSFCMKIRTLLSQAEKVSLTGPDVKHSTLSGASSSRPITGRFNKMEPNIPECSTAKRPPSPANDKVDRFYDKASP